MQPYNLDEGVSEYFEFILKGFTYRFRYPTTDELEGQDIKDIKKDEESVKNVLFKFITKVDPKAPDFEEVSKKMTVPNWRNFRIMLVTEMSADGKNNQGKENTPTES